MKKGRIDNASSFLFNRLEKKKKEAFLHDASNGLELAL